LKLNQSEKRERMKQNYKISVEVSVDLFRWASDRGYSLEDLKDGLVEVDVLDYLVEQRLYSDPALSVDPDGFTAVTIQEEG
tara:strand:+ start:418 stop:660 length:243 start_codon:yes stop_codon:yes gene_type:complete